ncbi:MAG: tetratricopeptide repeat protein [Chitinivibrionales bacterium]|nr:tetratricopeptide repeat protein [Chitinivibrionales bacterium]
MQASKLSVLCDKLIEAGWLAAVIVTPVFFNMYSTQIFELQKMALLRSIAVIMAAAWGIRWFEQHNVPRRDSSITWHSPLVLPAFIVGGVCLLSTIASVFPSISFLGTNVRAQGSYSTLAFIFIFFMIMRGVRSCPQIDRLVLSIIISSFPVALYGIIQQLNLDSLVWGAQSAGRVPGNLGNPIFLGGYLIMASALTAGKTIQTLRVLLTTKSSFVVNGVRVLCYGIIASAQIIALVFTQSRGPWTGWLIGTFFFVIVTGLLLKRRKLVFTAVSLGLVGMVFLIVLNLPHSPLEKLRALPYFERLGKITESKGGTSIVRQLYWKGASHLVAPHTPLEYPDGHKDALNVLRPLIGYGPEAIYVVFNRFFDPELGHVEARKVAMPDRSHNETWDLLIFSGILGLLAFHFFFASIFVYGFKWTGLIATKGQRNIFIGLWAGLGIIGGLVTIVLGKPFYLGLGIPFGILAGIFIYLILYAFAWHGHQQETTTNTSDRIILAALMAGLLAHFIEIEFGIAVGSTRLLFWVFAAMIPAIARGIINKKKPLSSPARSPGVAVKKNGGACDAVIQNPSPNLIGYAFIAAIALSTLFFDFITNSAFLSDAMEIFWRSLTFINIQYKVSFAILIMILLTWLTTVCIIFADNYPRDLLKKTAGRLSSFLLFAALSLGLSFGFGFFLSGLLAKFMHARTNTIDALITISENLADLPLFFYEWLFLLMGAAAIAFIKESAPLPAKTLTSGLKSVGVIVLIGAAAFLGINYSNIRPVRADCINHTADSWNSQGRTTQAMAAYQQALKTEPWEEHYYLLLGKTFIDKAITIDNSLLSIFSAGVKPAAILHLNPQQIGALGRNDLFLGAESILTHALSMNPLNTDHSANLGSLYFWWGAVTVDSVQKARLLALSGKYYSQATKLSPHHVSLLNGYAAVEMARGNTDSARTILDRSLNLDSQFVETFFVSAQKYILSDNLDSALIMIKKTLEAKPRHIKALNMLAFVYAKQGKLDEAISAYQRLFAFRNQLDPLSLCNAHKNLAVLYEQTGDHYTALDEAKIAVVLAPDYAKGAYQAYVDQLRKLPAK